eukprot:6206694-Pleurochrysis_carterae.AAC.1
MAARTIFESESASTTSRRALLAGNAARDALHQQLARRRVEHLLNRHALARHADDDRVRLARLVRLLRLALDEALVADGEALQAGARERRAPR